MFIPRAGQHGARRIVAAARRHARRLAADPALSLEARHAASHDLPWLAREINVALGGSAASGHSGSCRGATTIAAPVADAGALTPERYAPAHPVAITGGGCLAAILGRDEVVVNSVHGQGIDRPADGVHVEALAPDGQIEAISLAARFRLFAGAAMASRVARVRGRHVAEDLRRILARPASSGVLRDQPPDLSLPPLR